MRSKFAKVTKRIITLAWSHQRPEHVDQPSPLDTVGQPDYINDYVRYKYRKLYQYGFETD